MGLADVSGHQLQADLLPLQKGHPWSFLGEGGVVILPVEPARSLIAGVAVQGQPLAPPLPGRLRKSSFATQDLARTVALWNCCHNCKECPLTIILQEPKRMQANSELELNQGGLAQAYTLCSHEKLLANPLAPRMRDDCQVADVGHILWPLVCHKGALLNPLCWQVRALHIDYHRAQQTYLGR